MTAAHSTTTTTTESHRYVAQNGKVVRETIKTDDKTEVLDFLYDEQGRPFALNYSSNGGETFSTYYYILNLQGDVVKLVWSPVSGDHVFEYVEIVSYTYNAWGETLSSSGEMADVNPLRYRGYYYDSETGLYYLQSRYYDPVTHRFINADAPEYSEMAAYSLDDSNLFAYCGNNPVVCEDEEGELFDWLVRAVVGVAVQYVSGVIDNIASGKTGWDILKPTSSVGTYIAAGVSAIIPGTGLGANFARNVVTEGIESIEREINGEENSFLESAGRVVAGTLLDTGTEKLSSKITNAIRSNQSPNYSTYAHKVYLTNPGASRQQIYAQMRRSGNLVGIACDGISFVINVGRNFVACMMES